jgi:hypothetical protein
LFFSAKFANNLSFKSLNGAKIGFFSGILIYLIAKWRAQNRAVNKKLLKQNSIHHI